MAETEMVDTVQHVYSWLRDDPKRSVYDSAAPEPLDWRAVVQDIAVRIETLQSAKARVIVAVDSSRISLSTVVKAPAPAPKPATPPPPVTTSNTTVQAPLGVSCTVAGCLTCAQKAKTPRSRKAAVKKRR